MNFFSQLHRSIFDSSFYKEVIGFTAGRVVLYVFGLCLLCALVCGVAHTYYVMDLQRGLPNAVAELLPGMEIRNSMLLAHRPLPYLPPSSQVNAFMETCFNNSGLFSGTYDSLLVVDTAVRARPAAQTPVQVILTRSAVLIYSRGLLFYSIPLSKIFKAQETLLFTPEGIRIFLLHHRGALASLFIYSDGLLNCANILFSLFFLTLASFIFKVDKKYGFFAYFKIASFAVTPIAVGSMLLALSGTRLNWVWQVFIIAATVVMFRGVSAVIRIDHPRQQRNELL